MAERGRRTGWRGRGGAGGLSAFAFALPRPPPCAAHPLRPAPPCRLPVLHHHRAHPLAGRAPRRLWRRRGRRRAGCGVGFGPRTAGARSRKTRTFRRRCCRRGAESGRRCSGPPVPAPQATPRPSTCTLHPPPPRPLCQSRRAWTWSRPLKRSAPSRAAPQPRWSSPTPASCPSRSEGCEVVEAARGARGHGHTAGAARRGTPATPRPPLLSSPPPPTPASHAALAVQS